MIYLRPQQALALSMVLALASTTLGLTSAQADTFGTGPNTFTIDFVIIGNPGNADDINNPWPNSGDGGTPYGGVGYIYGMGVTEVPQLWVDHAINLGLSNVVAGAWTGLKPAANMTWYEAAAFVNWLNTSTGHQAAYDLTWTSGNWTMAVWSSADAWQSGGENVFRHKDAYYFLPSDDEWYKAAYHKNDGVTANYWDYPTASNDLPDGIDSIADPNYQAVFDDGYTRSEPEEVTSAGSTPSAYGTYAQGGNVMEWNEGSIYGHANPNENRAIRGGDWGSSEAAMRSSINFSLGPNGAQPWVGFRVASVPEPSSALLLTGAGLGLLLQWRRKA